MAMKVFLSQIWNAWCCSTISFGLSFELKEYQILTVKLFQIWNNEIKIAAY